MPDFIKGKDIASLYDEHQSRYDTSMRQMQAARDLLAGRIKAPLDASILPGEDDREALRSSTPAKYWLPMRIAAKIQAKEYRIKRYPIGIGQRAMSAATKVEQVDNAAADMLYPDGPVTDNLLNEGACFVVTQPQMSLWSATPDSMYDDPESRTKISKRYAVDSKGRGEDDDYYVESKRQFKPNESKSAEYFTSVEKDYRARNVPIEMRALSCREAIPLNPRRKGDEMLVDGLIRKSEWSVSSLLQAGYRWGESGHMEPSGPEGTMGSGGTKNLTMHELWYVAPNGHVYTSYCVDGKTTYKNDAEAVIDLTEEYGIECLPVAFDYGLGFDGEINPNDRPVPFVNIFGRSWLNEDTAKTFMLVRGYKEANLFRAVKLDANLMQVLGVTDAPPPLEIKPGFISYILGDMQDMNSSAGMREMIDLIGLLRSNLDDQLPSSDALGGGDDVAGYARIRAGIDVLSMFGQVMRGRRNLKAASMAHFNEQVACIGRKHRPVCLFVNQEIPVEQRVSQQSSTRAIIEIDPEMFGDVWQVTAEVPAEIGDNMALAQVLSEHHDRGKIPHEWLLEKGYGDPAPDVTIAKIQAEKAMNTPLGLAQLNMMAAKIAGDEQMADIMEGLAAQELVKLMPMEQPNPNNVVPSAIGAGLQAPQGGGMTGMVAPNPVDASVGGIMAGAMNAGAMAQPGGMV